MTSLYDELIENDHILQKWFYGHFHETVCTLVNSIIFVMLSIGQLEKIEFNEY